MIDEVLRDIPIEYREKFELFLAEPPIADDVLVHQMNQYLETVRLLAPIVKGFNLETMERLGTGGLELLKIAAGEDQRRLAQAAVRYLVEEEEDDEVTGVLGLDDDVQIANAVIRAFGRLDLLVNVR